MGYDKTKHHRRSIRLPGWDYTASGAYFVTVCTAGRECVFEDKHLRKIVEHTWRSIVPGNAEMVPVDLVVMPNHVHGIVWLPDRTAVGAQHAKCPDDNHRTSPPGKCGSTTSDVPGAAPLRTFRDNVAPGSVGAYIRSFKGTATKRINRALRRPYTPVWQDDFHERIIRDERELLAKMQYILDNPKKWELDENNPRNWRER